MPEITGEVELACENPKCPASLYDEGGVLVEGEVWWTAVAYDRATGASDYLEPDCPTCREPGEPTGQAEG